MPRPARPPLSPAPARTAARSLLNDPAHAAARTVTNGRVARAAEKALPLLQPLPVEVVSTIGNEDVHGFRVALRRLRSWLRASNGLLDAEVRKRDRAALRKMAQRAGTARDAQVQWQWLRATASGMSAPAIRAAAWLADQRAAEYVTARARLQHHVTSRWPRLLESLTARLESTPASPPDSGEQTLGQHLAPELLEHLELARQALAQIVHPTQVKEIHRARIEVKRLRYLLEEVDRPSPARSRALKHLRELQDVLGELHDAHVMAEELDPILAPRRRGRSSRRPTGRPAVRDLRALRAALRQRELAAFRQSLQLIDALALEQAWQTIAALAMLLQAPTQRRATTPRKSHARPAR